MEATGAEVRPLAVLESVRCLECGEVYAKPAGGSTVQRNPGCSACGYLGWIPLTLPREPAALHRFAAGRPQLHFAPTR